MNDIEIWQSQNLLVFKPEYTLDFIEYTIESLGLNGLRFFEQGVGHGLENLDVLRGATKINTLNITVNPPPEITAIYDMTNVKRLAVIARDQIVKLAELPYANSLESLSIDDNSDVIGLSACKALKRLSIPNLSKHIDELLTLKNLEWLFMSKSNIKTLDGFSSLHSLKELSIYNQRTLTSINGLNGSVNLEKLEIDACSNIKDYEKLIYLPKLKELSIINCKEIPSLHFIEEFKSLEKFKIVGNTKIVDGNFTYAKHVPHIVHNGWEHYFGDVNFKK